jgi:hypothetical protein
MKIVVLFEKESYFINDINILLILSNSSHEIGNSETIRENEELMAPGSAEIFNDNDSEFGGADFVGLPIVVTNDIGLEGTKSIRC